MAIGVGLGLLACSSSDNPTAPSASSLRVELTDAPTDEVTEINVYIVGLTVKPGDGPLERIADEVGLVDLLTLQGTTQLLAVVAVEPGDYEFIRVDLDETRSSVVEKDSGEVKELKIPSEEIKVNGAFVVEEDGTTTLVLDFDAEESLKKRGNGEWLLEPLIVLDQVIQS